MTTGTAVTMVKSLAIVIAIGALGCASTRDRATPREREPLVIGPQLGETHVTQRTPPPPSARPPPAVIEARKDLLALVPAVQALCDRPADRVALAHALRSLADALFVIAARPEDLEAINEQRRAMLAEIDVLDEMRDAGPEEQATRVRAILDRAVLAITGGTARTVAEQPAYNLAAAQLSEAVRHVDPAEPLAAQPERITIALRLATNTLYAALGLRAPFAMPAPVTG